MGFQTPFSPRGEFMLKKLSTASLIIALLLSIGGTSALARNSSADGAEPDAVPMSTNASVTKAESSRKLRGSVEQLVTEAKAGRLIPAERSQIQPAQSNSLSKKTKILIGAAIAATVITIIVIKHERDKNFMTIALF
jgi:hypothetical protein